MNLNIPVKHPWLAASGAKPTASQILQAQLAINLTDRKLFTLDQSGTIQQIGLAPIDVAVVALTGKYSDLIGAPPPSGYTLPAATSSVRGGITVGTGLSVTGTNADTLNNTGVLSINGSHTGAVVLDATYVGLPTDLLSGGNGTIATKYLPAALTGGLSLQGNWNASTNSPTLASGGIGPGGTQLSDGSYFVVGEAGTTTLDGISSWGVGDLALVSNGVWTRIANSGTNVISINGKTGVVTLVASDITGFATVATTGAYSDLTGKPTLATVATTGNYSSLNGLPNLATVATTGNYSDLNGLPTNPDVARLPVNVQGNPNIVNEVFYDFAQGAQFPLNFSGSVCTAKLVSGTTAQVTIWQYNAANPDGVKVGTISINTSTGNTFTSTQQATTFEIGDELSYRFDTNIGRFTVNLLGTWLTS
jgi:hypothetical protein